MVLCYIGIGSNLGDRQYYIDAAVRKMRMLPGTKVRKVSCSLETLPQGGPVQGPYLNAVAEIETGLDPYHLLRELQNIETGLGRVRTVVNGPRTIDLDILTYGDTCITEEALCIPHPRILEREFVLAPLREIAPAVIAKIKKLASAKKKAFKKTVSKAGRAAMKSGVKKLQRKKRK